MGRYIIRQLLQAIPLLIAISFVVFMVMTAAPGGPLSAYENNPRLTPEDLARLQEKFGLNTPAPVRYLNWLGSFVQGDWGYSISQHRPVIDMITEKLGNTLLLMGLSFILSLLIAFPVGILAASKQYSWFDYFTTTFSFIGLSIPIFWSGLMAIIIFSVTLGWLPSTGTHTVSLNDNFDLGDRVAHLILPVTVLALNSAGQYTRYIRASMLEVLGQDFIRTARAKGLRERIVFWRHAIKNASIPVVTVAALDLPALFGGAIITESIFAWPGMGQLFWRAANPPDYAVLIDIVTISAALVIFFNLVADVLYAWLDPRIKYK
jgi:peptide/nickel transport system permease protein